MLETDKNRVNLAKKQVSKLCLDRFWGTFGLRSKLCQTVLIKEPEGFFKYVYQKSIKSLTLRFSTPRWLCFNGCIPMAVSCLLLRSVTYLLLHSPRPYVVQVFTARVLYYDTDGLIYMQREEESGLELGNYLGELTDEPQCDSREG